MAARHNKSVVDEDEFEEALHRAKERFGSATQHRSETSPIVDIASILRSFGGSSRNTAGAKKKANKSGKVKVKRAGQNQDRSPLHSQR